MQTFSNSIYPKDFFQLNISQMHGMEKQDNGGALLISAVFGTR